MMGPEDSYHEGFKIKPGRVFMVPLGADGEPMGEPQEVGPGTYWGTEWGFDGGLDGGLEGGPSGALMEVGREISKSWTLELTGEVPEETMALLLGLSVEQYRDLKRWVGEKTRLERLTGLNWSLE